MMERDRTVVLGLMTLLGFLLVTAPANANVLEVSIEVLGGLSNQHTFELRDAEDLNILDSGTYFPAGGSCLDAGVVIAALEAGGLPGDVTLTDTSPQVCTQDEGSSFRIDSTQDTLTALVCWGTGPCVVPDDVIDSDGREVSPLRYSLPGNGGGMRTPAMSWWGVALLTGALVSIGLVAARRQRRIR